MNITQALEDSRIASRGPTEMDPKLLAHIARASIKENDRATLKALKIAIAAFVAIAVVLIIANAYEQATMTQVQKQTLAKHPQDN